MARAVRSKLRQLRLNLAAAQGREVTMKEVCDATGIALSTLSRIENNQVQSIEFATLVKLADFYGVKEVGELLSLEEIRRALRTALAGHLTARRALSEVTGSVGAVPALPS
ncbi:MAG: helix-turn-helix transcriptional regulator [Chloroflexales bacterium]|nr:helix-turn-helix transcriptional regulator [Chloroflexales bacterium]